MVLPVPFLAGRGVFGESSPVHTGLAKAVYVPILSHGLKAVAIMQFFRLALDTF